MQDLQLDDFDAMTASTFSTNNKDARVKKWFDAAQIGHLDIIQNLAQHCSRQFNQVGQTALQVAVQNNQLHIVRFLLPYEAGVQSIRTETALYHAIMLKNYQAVNILAAYEYSIQSYQVLPIFYALDCNAPEAAKILIQFCRSRETYVNVYGQTAYTKAIIDRKVDFIDVLGVQLGDTLDEYQKHPFIYAIQTSNVEIIAQTYSYTKFNPNHSILDECYQNGHILNTEILFQKYAKLRNKFNQTALMTLCKQTRKQKFTQQEVETVSKLALHEITLQDSDNQTSLMFAAQTGKLELLPILCEKEARFQDKFGHSALIKSVIKTQIESVKFLKQFEMKIIDNQGNTALKFAVQLNNEELVEILQDEIQTENSAIQRAVVKNNMNMVNFMKNGFQTLDSDLKGDLYELSASRNIMSTMRDVMSLGGDFELVKSRVLDRHCGWDLM
ncbi:Ankyrin repeat-containing protein [Spironucleus salmonicida]|uniref:Ankyrin repeat-containing protein n=1 Tax=Spironucleus salmonicida TaxID=348837 RepID=V6LT72_9EUKA|nr:Ankyrin repeat-containing protein [Spironucleus salmonicida]|eukprot:EST46891.1 Ankyrin repeat-containing protein [Spironucleus salmonicida]